MADEYDAGSNNPNEITITGADPPDPGPRGVLAKFLKASVTRDEETARALLTVSSVDGFDIEIYYSRINKGSVRRVSIRECSGRHSNNIIRCTRG